MTRRIRLALRLHAPSLASGATDFAIVLVSYALALALRFDLDVPDASWRWYVAFVPLIAAAYVLANAGTGVYRSAWQYGGLTDAVNLAKSTALVTVVVTGIIFFVPKRHLPLSVALISGVLTFLGMAVAKLLPRLLARGPFLEWDPQAKRVLVIGAGNTGQMLIRECQQHRGWGFRPIGLIDDDPRKLNRLVHGVPVLGAREDISSLIRSYQVDVAVLAMPSAPGSVIRETVDQLQALGVPVRTLPGLDDLISRPMKPADLREVTAEDLLGREPLQIDQRECARALQGKVVLVSGAAGSIGSELARQILSFHPAELYLLDNNESGLHDVVVHLESQRHGCPVTAWVADVTNYPKLSRLIAEAQPQVIFHAAAYKHVHLMEEHPDEAFRVNVLGTLNLCRLARSCGTERFVFISTDKAVNPVGVMGATKRIGERLIRAVAGEGKPIFCTVRFGNVIGSRGSVVPTFLRQIEAGGPVSVTHPDAARYFLTISEAISLVIQAAAFAGDGDIYMLDMGDEIRIDDLAKKMIRLRGLQPNGEIPIVYTGLRPGERLREPLVGPDETVVATRHHKVFLLESSDRPSAASFIPCIEAVGLTDIDALREKIVELCSVERTEDSVRPGP